MKQSSLKLAKLKQYSLERSDACSGALSAAGGRRKARRKIQENFKSGGQAKNQPVRVMSQVLSGK